ncbi:hypothetical protein ACLF3G_15170 [Falsiroseomonas sp. HC035]|uniref:hypothetical protein n=1 Tax=Falsiroseomonas sp. HC035 TaxID=3390999 RepID=UPI003D3109FA
MPHRTILRRLLGLLLLACLVQVRPALAQGDPSFNLVNRSGQVIREIYVSPTDERYWGADLLQAEVLPNGRSFAVRLPPASGCRQDVRVVYADGRPEERRAQDTCRIAQMVFGTNAAPTPGTTQGPGGSENPSFNLVNHGALNITAVHVSPVEMDSWGSNRLGEQRLAPGQHLRVRLRSGECENDIRIVWADGRSEERRRIDTCRIVNMVFGQ